MSDLNTSFALSLSPAARAAADAIREVSKWLPSQGPIDVFIHHNTLHHFEDLKFEDAVEQVAKVRNAKPYLSHEEYLSFLHNGRIKHAEVEKFCRRYANDRPLQSIGGIPLSKILLAAVTTPITLLNQTSVAWLLNEKNDPAKTLWGKDSKKIIDDTCAELEELIGEGANGPLLNWLGLSTVSANNKKLARMISNNRSQIAAKFMYWCVDCKLDSKLLPPLLKDEPKPRQLSEADELTIMLCSAYLDQGTAQWPMPERSLGFLKSTLSLALLGEKLITGRLRWLAKDGINLEQKFDSSYAFVAQLLRHYQLPESAWSDIIREALLPVLGWAGMMATIERDPSLGRGINASLADFVAVRLLLLDRSILSLQKKNQVALPTEVSKSWPWHLTELLAKLGKSSRDVGKLSHDDLSLLAVEISCFDDLSRRRILHEAYEASYYDSIVGALAAHKASLKGYSSSRPSFQIVLCLDEREESLRRHLEEVDPNCETFGAAGFFNIKMLYKTHALGELVPLCPVAVKPFHLISEIESKKPLALRWLESFDKLLHRHTRHTLTSPILTFGAGLAAAIPLALKLSSPRTTARLKKRLSQAKYRPSLISLDRSKSTVDDNLLHGFTPSEMADCVEGLLRTIGLTKTFARLVFIVGHGSRTANNPFASAYECGACGGRRGNRNGRIFALMANRTKVRKILMERGLMLPDDTIFVGGCHDTCSEEIELFDLDRVPASHKQDLESAEISLEKARASTAQERTRRFNVGTFLPPRKALQHVERRSVDIREPRPEYGHGSNAYCVIGRRRLTRGLFLDRRSFLVSYDTDQDPHTDILKGILQAVVPVCTGINLEYFFSRIDNQVFGAGSKLPHNLVSMLGVMDGYKSDLRTGLPWQTVEIHEPMRLLFIIEASANTLVQALQKLPDALDKLKKNWFFIVCMDPVNDEILSYDGQTFSPFHFSPIELKKYQCSHEYYRQQSSHLPPAELLASLGKEG